MEEKFNIVVPYNNETMVEFRKKNKISASVIMFIAAAFFIALAVFCGVAKNSSLVGAIMFALFAAGAIAYAIVSLCTMKPQKKDENKKVEYVFYDSYLQIKIHKDETKVKTVESCAYKKYKDKQHVDLVTETDKLFDFRILVGTTNGIANYTNHVIPKTIFANAEELDTFKQFLKERVQKYVEPKLAIAKK